MFKKTPKIILIEDDPIVFQLQEYIIEKELGVKPLWFKNGLEAINYLRQESKNLKSVLLFLDLNMPQMNGWEFLDACKAESFEFKILTIILTSSLFLEDRLKAQNYGIYQYQLKPLRRQALKEIIKRPEVAEILTNLNSIPPAVILKNKK